jgi:hypothetical protein
MTHPIVLRFKEMWPYELAKMDMHGRRAGGDLDHIDASRTDLNRVLVGEPDWVRDLLARIECMKLENHTEEMQALKKNSRKKDLRRVARRGPQDPWANSQRGPLREVVLTANKDFFTAKGFEEVMLWDDEKVAQFEEVGCAFLKENFGDALVYLRLDLDEDAPHLHGIIAPFHEKTSKGRGRQQLLQPSAYPLLQNYEKSQDVAGEWFQEIGLRRGKNSAAERRAAIKKARDPRSVKKIPGHVSPAEKRAQEMERIGREKAAAEKRKLEAEAAERKAKEAEKRLEAERCAAAERKAREDAERAELQRKEDAERAVKAAELKKREKAVAEREAEVSRKAKLLGRAVDQFYTLLEKVKSFARKIGMKDEVLDRNELDAVKRVKDIVGKIGGDQRTR